ncbi:MAG: zinc-dependent metalloprotease [Planctomycetia bacterium]|nr:zinc-dependent metalloprotease [Planctomycetia bacterium]
MKFIDWLDWRCGWAGIASVMLAVVFAGSVEARAQAPDFPPAADVLKDYKKVAPPEGDSALYNLYVRAKDSHVLAELPRDYLQQKYFMAMTVASGDQYAGLQSGDRVVYWRRYDKRLALMDPNITIRSGGDPESQSSVNRLFTDRLITEVPIVTMSLEGSPIVDFNQLLVMQSGIFFGSGRGGAGGIRNPGLVTVKKAKVFSKNVEVAYEVPTAGGQLQTLHYSISEITPNTQYQPRKADERIGYFTTSYADYGKYLTDETKIRFINRWHLVKRDPSLKLSPPVKPIEFIIEHTTPVRYRRWVKEGTLYWNKAFEKVGIIDAIVVLQQDAQTRQYMDRDPEDVRWNFIRWLNNNISTAIGPSRVNPWTGEILDADIILTDGWIRHFNKQFSEILPSIAMEGFDADTLSWLARNPKWDPRVRLAAPSQRNFLASQIQRDAATQFSGHPMSRVNTPMLGDDPFDGLTGRTSQVNGMCLASEAKGVDLALARMAFELDAAQINEQQPGAPVVPEETKLDGMPESFIGPLLAELVAHEVGHTLGLRHNFKASSIYTLAQINSDEIKGKKPLAGSVMDYTPINMHVPADPNNKSQGDYTLASIGPYDMWAIEYGYTFSGDLKPILDRVAEPELAYATDEDTLGPDPLARRYDFSKNPLDYAQNQTRLIQKHRAKIIDTFVKDGQSWSKARYGYELTFNMQMQSTSMMANWLGGAFINRDRKGDKNGRAPIEPVPAAMQREALKFVIGNAFEDAAFGLTPALLARMTKDKWIENDRMDVEDATYPITDRIAAFQASTLTSLLRPTALRRIYDNEMTIPADQDAITLPEVLASITANVWREADKNPDKPFTPRVPMISSLRRNLQQEHLDRLIELTLPAKFIDTEASKAIANLALVEVKKIQANVERILKEAPGNLDPYTASHLQKVQTQITKALNAEYIYNANAIGGGGGGGFFILFQPTPEGQQPGASTPATEPKIIPIPVPSTPEK